MEPEEGELSSSSDEVYIPLQRPEAAIPKPIQNNVQITENLDDQEEPEEESNSSSEDSSDNCLQASTDHRQKPRTKRTVMLRVQSHEDEAKKRRFKRYNIWTATAEEEALTENMRGCDVRHNRANDRSVETYSCHFVNGRKRRRDGMSDDEMYPMTKRGRDSSQDSSDGGGQRKPAKSRLGKRLILDLEDTNNKEPADVGREIANKLFEEKDELLVRVVEVLGIEKSVELYKETQRIESEGGMMINNGVRRRTPGGVFLFLLKHDEKLRDADKKAIFDDDRQNVRRHRKDMDSAIRDRKVAELKQRLRKHENIPTLSTRKELHLATNLNVETESSNLSNPPPSPVAGQESSPEYKAPEIINHVSNDVSPGNASAAAALRSADKDQDIHNDDYDFLDLNAVDMDLF